MISDKKNLGQFLLGSLISLVFSLVTLTLATQYSALIPILIITFFASALSTIDQFKTMSLVWAISLLTGLYWFVGSVCSIFDIPIFRSLLFHQVTIGTIVFLSTLRLWICLSTHKSIVKTLDVKSIFLPLSALIFLIIPEKIRLASYLQSWDHVAGHIFTVRKIATTGFIPSFPADYFGFSPKAFHGLASGLGMGSIDGFELVGVIQVLEVLILLGILQIFLSHILVSVSPKRKITIFVVSSLILFSPFFMGWIYFMGFPPLLLAASVLFLLGLSSRLNPSQNSILYLLIATVTIQSWTLLFPVIVMHSIYLGVKKQSRTFKMLLFLCALLIANGPSIISIYLNNKTSQFSIGPRYSGLVYQLILLCVLISIFFLFRCYARFPSLAVLTYSISGLGIIIFLVQFDSDFGIPYYSLKLFWLSGLLFVFMAVVFLFDFSKSPIQKKIHKRAISLIMLLSCAFNFSELTPVSYFVQNLSPRIELQYQAEILLLKLDSQVDRPILYYSNSPYDSVAALFQHAIGFETIEPQIMWGAVPEICKYVKSKPGLRIVGTGKAELTKVCEET